MRRTTTWVAILGLGLAIALPATTMQAGPFDFFRGSESAKATPAEVAREVANALRASNLRGRDIDIEFRNGTVTLSGIIADPGQKARATQAASHVEGVENVVNNMRVAGVAAAADARRGVVLASGEQPAPLPTPRATPAPRTAATPPVQPAVSQFAETTAAPVSAVAGPSNQQIAQSIADALGERNLQGSDIGIRYQNGIATLSGTVASPQDWEIASRTARSVAGVDRVLNRMQVGMRRTAARPSAPVVPVGYRQPGPMPGGAPAAPPAGWNPPQPPQAYGHGGPGMSNAAYTMPNLPDYAWPAQAAYPNSAQISYPQMYSASAWPYIGPFYPYPQVPLGWREAQLEWDDGYWYLNFKPRTSKWFWFANPRNWK